MKNGFMGLIPNGLSMLNLIFGFLSIISAIEGNFTNAAMFIIIAIIADGADGKAARKVKAVSDMGAEFDSLADLVSFGVAPAILLYVYAFNTIEYGIFFSLLMVACAALRLARFNVDRSSDYFMGLPSPAFGFLGAAYVLSGLSLNVTFLAGIFAIASLTMVGKIKYPSFKTTSLKGWAILIGLCTGIFVLTLMDIRFIVAPFILYGLLGPFVYRFMIER